MTATAHPATADAAAQACIGAAARELHLPTVRTEAARLAEIADRERHTHLRYLAEVPAAEVDDRTERRRARRINDAKFPRLKRLAEFNIDAIPTITPALLGQLAAGHYMDAGEPSCFSGTPEPASPTYSSDSGWQPANKAAESDTSPPHNWSTNS